MREDRGVWPSLSPVWGAGVTSVSQPVFITGLTGQSLTKPPWAADQERCGYELAAARASVCLCRGQRCPRLVLRLVVRVHCPRIV